MNNVPKTIFYNFIQESLVGGYGAPPHSINYKVDFYTKSIDLNNDDSDDVSSKIRKVMEME